MLSLRKTLIAVAGLCLFLATSTAFAEPGWNLRFGAAWTDLDGEVMVDSDFDETIQTDAGSTYGFGLAVEYRWSDRLGLQVGYMDGFSSDLDVVLSDAFGPFLSLSDDLDFSILDVALNIRINPGDGPEVYVGPVLAQISYDDLAFEVMGETARLGLDDDLAYGVVVGVDATMGTSGWFFNGGVKYLMASARVKDLDDPDDPGVDVDFDPLMLFVGFGYGF